MKPVAFKLFGGTFTFRLWPAITTLIMLATLIGLGSWQVQRLHWKENIIATMHERMQERPIDVGLSDILPENIPNMDYHPGKASGIFMHDKELYLSGISVRGEGGYMVLTPLQADNGHIVLVNRGWVPYDKKLPAARPESQQAGPVNISGTLRIPHGRQGMQPENQPGKNEWYWIDLPAMAQAAGVESFLPYVLDADDTPKLGGYPVGGQTRIDIPNNHLNYAITWFSLAGVLLIIYMVFSWRRPKKALVAVAQSAKSEGEQEPPAEA